MIKRWRLRRRLKRTLASLDDVQIQNLRSFLSSVTGRPL